MLHPLPFPSHFMPQGREGWGHLPHGLGWPGRDHQGLGDISWSAGNLIFPCNIAPSSNKVLSQTLTLHRRHPKADHLLARLGAHAKATLLPPTSSIHTSFPARVWCIQPKS